MEEYKWFPSEWFEKRENEEKNVSRDFPKLKRNFQYDSNQI